MHDGNCCYGYSVKLLGATKQVYPAQFQISLTITSHVRGNAHFRWNFRKGLLAMVFLTMWRRHSSKQSFQKTFLNDAKACQNLRSSSKFSSSQYQSDRISLRAIKFGFSDILHLPKHILRDNKGYWVKQLHHSQANFWRLRTKLI